MKRNAAKSTQSNIAPKLVVVVAGNNQYGRAGRASIDEILNKLGCSSHLPRHRLVGQIPRDNQNVWVFVRNNISQSFQNILIHFPVQMQIRNLQDFGLNIRHLCALRH